MKGHQFTAHVGRDHDTGLFYGIVPALPGAYTQAESLDELNRNLQEVIKLCLEELDPDELDTYEFVGLQQISVAV